MKKITLFGLLFAALAFAACKKDKDEPVSVVGKWYIKKAVDISFVNGAKDDEDISTVFNSNDYLELKSDGTAILSEDDAGNADIETFTYVVNENKLTLKETGSNDTDTFDIRALEKNNLVLYNEDSYTSQGITYKYTSELSFTR